MINFPTTLDTTTQLPTEASGTVLHTNHITAHTNLAAAIIALETKLGINSSAVNTTHDYKLSGVTTGDKAVSKTGTEILTNKTLGSGTKILLGSDATLDIYFNGGSGVLTRLPAGTSLQQLRVNSGATALEYFTPAALVDASYSVKGIVEFLTDAATSGITVTSGVVSVNSGTSANQILKLNGSAKIPAVDGSLITGTIFSTSDIGAPPSADSTQTITHGLGRTPTIVRISGLQNFTASVSSSTPGISLGSYNNSANKCQYITKTTGGSTATLTTTSTYAIVFSDGGGNLVRGAIGNITSTTFDIVWLTSGINVSGSATYHWETQ